MHKVTKTHQDYPQAFQHLNNPPQFIYLNRSYSWHEPLIAVVGARDIHPWVVEWLESELYPVLKKHSVGIVSGGARGVDQAAHALAFRAQVPNVFVIPSGFENIYPKKIQAFYENEKSVFLTEYEPDQVMLKHHFYLRNRLIAALAPITLVLQARERSGTMITARLARDMGKTLLVVPSSPLDPSFAGSNQLLYEGAQLVRNSLDIEAAFAQEFTCYFSSNCDGPKPN